MRLTHTSRTAATAAVFVVAAGIGLAAFAGGQAATQGRGGQGQQGQTQGQTGQGQAGRGAQQPARDTGTTQPQPAATGTAIIAGYVTTAGSGGPVRRARVTLSGTGGELRGGRSTLTNDEGHFTFAALPAGRFTLRASKAGYVDVPFGAKRPGRPGTPIQLVDKQKLENANIALPKGAVITGMVIDESGEPAPGTQVRVMRFVMQTGERTLQSAGQAQADDRGFYRVWGLQPGEYLISAVPRNQGMGDLRNTIAAEVEMLLQQARAGGAGAAAGRAGGAGGGAGGGGGGGGGGRAAGRGLAAIDQMLAGGRGGNQDLLARAAQLQEQLAQSEQEQAVAYAPVYYPSTPSPSQSSTVTLGVGEERPGVDMQLRLVHTAVVEGHVQGVDGAIPQGTQITLTPIDQAGMPPVPGTSNNTVRAQQDGKFTFRDVAPGQYRVMARANIRAVDPNAQVAANGQAARGGGGRGGAGGPGGRGGPGQITQVLWGSADISVTGADVNNVSVSLQPGMTLSGRVSFEGQSALPPTDLTRVRINLSARGAQPGLDLGGLPPAEVDATGMFKIKGVPPGRYSINANAQAGQVPGVTPQPTGGRGGGAGGGGGQWILKSAMANGRDALDHSLVVEPNQEVSGMLLTFVDRTQEVSGTIQDTMGKPTSDYTIILFAADKAFWQPQARRIQSARPGTDGKFGFRNIPAGEYRITAVTDVEPGDWYDPEFLAAIISASIPVTVNDGEKKVQDLKVASSGGGH